MPIAEGETVTTQHGLVLLTTPADEAPPLTRRLTPRGGFTTALQDLATYAGPDTAASTAKMIGYPSPRIDLPHRAPLRLILLTSAGLGIAVLAGAAVARMLDRLLRKRTRPRCVQ